MTISERDLQRNFEMRVPEWLGPFAGGLCPVVRRWKEGLPVWVRERKIVLSDKELDLSTAALEGLEKDLRRLANNPSDFWRPSGRTTEKLINQENGIFHIDYGLRLTDGPKEIEIGKRQDQLQFDIRCLDTGKVLGIPIEAHGLPWYRNGCRREILGGISPIRTMTVFSIEEENTGAGLRTHHRSCGVVFKFPTIDRRVKSYLLFFPFTERKTFDPSVTERELGVDDLVTLSNKLMVMANGGFERLRR